jgi:hypothetical protein
MSLHATRLVQLINKQHKRCVALVQEPSLQLLRDTTSVYQLALDAIDAGATIKDIIDTRLSGELLDYTSVYNGNNDWQLLPSFDHPEGPFGCIVSGTGLTHKNSALNRQMMHGAADAKPTDSIRMYQWGVEGGAPATGTIGTQPEWFYKGNGSMLKAHGQSLEIPAFGNDGGEEPEVAGIYIIDKKGQPWRIGFSTANEFSDHVMEKKNYLYLAPSKLRNCSIGPELVIDEMFTDLTGTVKIIRNNSVVWSADIHTGQQHMAHSLENLEYHHFKYLAHQIPLQAHVHFFGADAFSFGSQIVLQDGDVMEIYWAGMGRALQNTLKIADRKEKMVAIKSLK